MAMISVKPDLSIQTQESKNDFDRFSSELLKYPSHLYLLPLFIKDMSLTCFRNPKSPDSI